MAVICRYNMTKFAMWLNEITPPGLDKKLAPTDCRLRPDQHALEEGIYDQVISSALPPSHDLCTADVSVYSLPDYHAWAPHHNLLMPLVLFTLLVLYMNNVFMACPCTVACCSMESDNPCWICEWTLLSADLSDSNVYHVAIDPSCCCTELQTVVLAACSPLTDAAAAMNAKPVQPCLGICCVSTKQSAQGAFDWILQMSKPQVTGLEVYKVKIA